MKFKQSTKATIEEAIKNIADWYPEEDGKEPGPAGYNVYQIEDDKTAKFIKFFEDVKEAVNFAKTLPDHSQVSFDPNGTDIAFTVKDGKIIDSFEYPYNIKPDEVVWDSDKPTKRIKKLTRI